MTYVLSTDADLNHDMNIIQGEIASTFDVSQPTVSQGIKEAQLNLKINELERELSDAKGEVLDINGIEALGISSNDNSIINGNPNLTMHPLLLIMQRIY